MDLEVVYGPNEAVVVMLWDRAEDRIDLFVPYGVKVNHQKLT